MISVKVTSNVEESGVVISIEGRVPGTTMFLFRKVILMKVADLIRLKLVHQLNRDILHLYARTNLLQLKPDEWQLSWLFGEAQFDTSKPFHVFKIDLAVFLLDIGVPNVDVCDRAILRQDLIKLIDRQIRLVYSETNLIVDEVTACIDVWAKVSALRTCRD